MYKSDIGKAFSRALLVPGGTISRLLERVRSVEAQLDVAFSDIAANGDVQIKKGIGHLHNAIKVISDEIRETSPLATAIELHRQAERIEAIQKEFPELEALLQPGRQALAALMGAFDVMLQRDKAPGAVIGLVTPSISLAACQAHYKALSDIFAEREEWTSAVDEFAIIEIDGADLLEAIATYMQLLSDLARAAQDAFKQAEAAPAAGIRIVSIESGSPIQLKLFGDGKTLRLLLSMLRDVVRTAYRYATQHGRALQSMETYALAKQLGIDSEDVLAQLESAMATTTRKYADSLRPGSVFVKVDGKAIQEGNLRALAAPTSDVKGILELPAPDSDFADTDDKPK